MRTTKRNQSFARLAALLVLASMIALPGFAASRGSANFTNLVAIGDSYGAGYESNSLNERHQPYSWPAILARQVAALDFSAGDFAAAPAYAPSGTALPADETIKIAVYRR